MENTMDNKKSTGIVIIGAAFVDIKGYPHAQYIPGGRNSGHVVEVHGGVARNIAEDIANIELRPTFLSVVDKSSLGEDVIRKLFIIFTCLFLSVRTHQITAKLQIKLQSTNKLVQFNLSTFYG